MLPLTKQERILLVFLFGVCWAGGLTKLVFYLLPTARTWILYFDESSQMRQLDVNRATVDDFLGLPGVGPALAQRIVTFRQNRGRFRSLEELREIPGIGVKKYRQLIVFFRI